MGARGPKPLPTNVLKLRGETRPSRLKPKQPTPPASEIKMPTGMTARAQTVWRRLAPSLIKRKVLTVWDVDAFEILCESKARHGAAFARYRKEGSQVVVPSERGGTKKNPLLDEIDKADAAYLRYAAHFGLTPSSRTGVQIDGDAGGSKSADLFTGGTSRG